MSGETLDPVAALRIRSARAGDWVAVSALVTASKLPLDGAREHLDDFLVAESAGALIGVIGVERYGDGGLLRSAAVDADWRGRGVGESLLEALLVRETSTGLRAMYLLTETAEGWFTRFGFARISRDIVPDSLRASVEFTTACPASAIVMQRALD